MRLTSAPSQIARNMRGAGLPGCACHVTPPSSVKPKPSASHAGTGRRALPSSKNISPEAIVSLRNNRTRLSSAANPRTILISRGENSGREITYHNVVRNLMKVGDWNGGAGSWTIPLESISSDGVDAAVVYVQDGSRDKPGPMLGAAYTSLH